MRKRLINVRPVVLIALGFILGLVFVAFTLFFKKYLFIAVISLTATALIAVIFILKSKNKKNYWYLTSFAVAFLIAAVIGAGTFARFEKARLREGDYETFGKVLSVTEIDEGIYTVILGDLRFNNDKVSRYKLKLSLIAPEGACKVGDNILFNGLVKNIDIINENQIAFNYIESGVRYFAEAKNAQIKVSKGNLTIFEKFNAKINDTLFNNLGYDEYSLGFALLTGETGFIDDFTLTNFRLGGVAHIFAISGLHIGFLAALLTLLLKWLKRPLLKATIITFILMFYSGVCGFTVSSLRATVMSATFLYFSSLGKKYDPLTSIALSAFLILLFSPFQLFTAGFLLSYACVVGIIILAPKINAWLSFLPRSLSSALSTVISAQLFALPLSIFYFGYFGGISLILNAILIPLVSIVFVTLFLFTFIGGISNFSAWFFFAPNFMLKTLTLLVNLTDYKKFAIFISITIGLSILYYVALFFLSSILNIKTKFKIIISSLLSIIFVFLIGFNSANNILTTKICVIGGRAFNATVFYGKETVAVLSNDADMIFSTRLQSFLKRKHINKIDLLIITSETDAFMVVNNLNSFSEIGKVIYYGERLDYLETSFEKITFCAYGDSDEISTKLGGFSFEAKGESVFARLNDSKIFVTHAKNVENNLYLGAVNFDLIIGKYELGNLDNILIGEVVGYAELSDGYASAKEENLYYKIKGGKLKRC